MKDEQTQDEKDNQENMMKFGYDEPSLYKDTQHINDFHIDTANDEEVPKEIGIKRVEKMEVRKGENKKGKGEKVVKKRKKRVRRAGRAKREKTQRLKSNDQQIVYNNVVDFLADAEHIKKKKKQVKKHQSTIPNKYLYNYITT